MYLTHDRIRHSSSANSLNGFSSPKTPTSQKKTKNHAKNILKSKNTGHIEEPDKYRTEVSSDEFMKVIATEIVNPFGPSLPQHGL